MQVKDIKPRKASLPARAARIRLLVERFHRSWSGGPIDPEEYRALSTPRDALAQLLVEAAALDEQCRGLAK